MAKIRNPHVVFSERDFKIWDWRIKRYRIVRAGVYIDLDELTQLVDDATRNKSRKAKDGPLHVEYHSLVASGEAQ